MPTSSLARCIRQSDHDPGTPPRQPILSHAGVGVGGGFLHAAERDPGVEGGGDERVPQGVQADLLSDARPGWGMRAARLSVFWSIAGVIVPPVRA